MMGKEDPSFPFGRMAWRCLREGMNKYEPKKTMVHDKIWEGFFFFKFVGIQFMLEDWKKCIWKRPIDILRRFYGNFLAILACEHPECCTYTPQKIAFPGFPPKRYILKTEFPSNSCKNLWRSRVGKAAKRERRERPHQTGIILRQQGLSTLLHCHPGCWLVTSRIITFLGSGINLNLHLPLLLGGGVDPIDTGVLKSDNFLGAQGEMVRCVLWSVFRCLRPRSTVFKWSWHHFRGADLFDFDHFLDLRTVL